MDVLFLLGIKIRLVSNAFPFLYTRNRSLGMVVTRKKDCRLFHAAGLLFSFFFMDVRAAAEQPRPNCTATTIIIITTTATNA